MRGTRKYTYTFIICSFDPGNSLTLAKHFKIYQNIADRSADCKSGYNFTQKNF